MTHQVRRLNLTYADLELHEQYVISTIKEDQVLDKEQIEEMRKIFYDHFGDRKWVYISNRKNKYNVNPVIYIDLIQRKSLIGIAIVLRENDGALTANFEKQFATIPFEMFDNKSEALAWAMGCFLRIRSFRRLQLTATTILFFTGFMMNAQQMKLVWQDEFDHSGKPDPTKWSYETGFIRNLEAQYYTSRKKNVRVKNGKLIITARNEYFENPDYDPAIKDYRINTPETNYTSGSIHTSGKFDFKYGRIDVRASLPKSAGSWPAIWMLGSNFKDVKYPEAGEIDIMEHVGKNQGEIHGSVHYANEQNEIVSKTDTTYVDIVTEKFHVYSVDWDRDRIQFLVDDEVYHTFEIADAGTTNNPFRKPFFLLINLALGGKWAGEIDDSNFPQKFKIDYVRVYQRIENKKAGL